MARGHFIGGRWVTGKGREFFSEDPATGEVVWGGSMATREEVDAAALTAAREVEFWASQTIEKRTACLKAFEGLLRTQTQQLAETLSLETGKPLWESMQELGSMAAKVDLTIQAYGERKSPEQFSVSGATGRIGYRHLGALAVLGPFNLPGHIPNGHILPALLSGNTVVFKPSRYTPAFAEAYTGLWEAAGIPAGVLNMIQGDREAVGSLLAHPDLVGLLFTGSYDTGKALHGMFAGRPEKTVVLEMGGNNPLVVFGVDDLKAAAYLTIISAFITAGQRCTCARRLILEKGARGDAFIESLADLAGGIQVGRFSDSPEPFHGPVISNEAAEKLLGYQDDLCARGGTPIKTMQCAGPVPAMLTPGIIDVTPLRERVDGEWFGPLLQVIRVPDFESAIEEAQKTSYGLAAGLLSDNAERYRVFSRRVRAGHMVWNRQTTGASGRLPFGGLGKSGNHRPSGYFAVDYCSDPVAALEMDTLALPARPLPGIAGISTDSGARPTEKRE
jgi:succinylglutamic semialdehyde dehydrogenase